jgi:uncharacterized membrane-anchored protein YjiN (DUF445 family)
MPEGNRVGRWAAWSLVGALALAILGRTVERLGPAPFWGGLLAAFGEAALVGGLADWFAVRALFAHPFGIPFPHTAIIPRNRPRIVREVRQLVEQEWLPRSLLRAKVGEFDFAGRALLPLVGQVGPHLRPLLRTLARDVLDDLSPEQLAAFLARGLAGPLTADGIGPFLGDLARRAREQDWLAPLLGELARRLQDWADAPECHAILRARLEEAARAYRRGDWVRSLTFNLAEALGGVDLDQAALAIQGELRRFADDQLGEGGPVRLWLSEELGKMEQRLRDDPAFLPRVKGFLMETAQSGTLARLLQPLLAALGAEGVSELEKDDSRFLDLAARQIESWMQRLAGEEELRARVNAWCQREGALLVEKHHGVVGALVQEQMNRLSEKDLSALIQGKVGEDLNWIRLNGSFVGGLVGTGLYLAFALFQWALG